jgi:hypothetical protein
MITAVRVFAGLAILWVTPALAWNSFGHMESAAVAWELLTPKAKQEATRLLKLNPQYKSWTKGVAADKQDQIAFVMAATWPDEIKTLPAYHNDGDRGGDVAPHTPEASQNIGYKDHFRHRYWHFIDEPFSTDGTPLQQPVPPNAQTQIATFRKTLGDKSVSDDIQSYDLSWLLHLIGDVHQPLHATSRFTKTEPNGDAGGNTVKTTCQSPCDGATELHAFWDDLLGDTKAPPQSAITAAAQLSPADAKDASQMDETVWINDSFALAKKNVYKAPVGDTDGPFKLTDAYHGDSLDIAKKQIALAGARIANMLNEAFK